MTRDGLEEQLLAEVVKTERPDLEMLKSNLTTQQNTFKITLKKCEDDLLMRLSSAGDNILSDASIVYNLETTKKTADEVEIKVTTATKSIHFSHILYYSNLDHDYFLFIIHICVGFLSLSLPSFWLGLL